jgi:pectin methylesterase-like acyl-CoA thioesterase
LQKAVDEFSSKNKNKSINWDILFGIYRRLIVALRYQQPTLTLYKRDAERLKKRYKEIKKKGKEK